MKNDGYPVTGDSLAVDVVVPYRFDGVDPEFAGSIRQAVNAMGAVGKDAEQIYQRSLRRLVEQSERVVEVVARELTYGEDLRYLDRWALVQLLAELRDPAAIPVLDELLTRPMSGDTARGGHGRTARRNRTIVLTTAVEAINRLAANGYDSAVELLRKHARHELLSVRRACVQGYVEHGGEGARDRLLGTLPKEDHYLLDIRRIDVREAPPVRPDPGPTRRRSPQTVADVPRVPPRLE